jgi:hypothetical protein
MKLMKFKWQGWSYKTKVPNPLRYYELNCDSTELGNHIAGFYHRFNNTNDERDGTRYQKRLKCQLKYGSKSVGTVSDLSVS